MRYFILILLLISISTINPNIVYACEKPQNTWITDNLEATTEKDTYTFNSKYETGYSKSKSIAVDVVKKAVVDSEDREKRDTPLYEPITYNLDLTIVNDELIWKIESDEILINTTDIRITYPMFYSSSLNISYLLLNDKVIMYNFEDKSIYSSEGSFYSELIYFQYDTPKLIVLSPQNGDCSNGYIYSYTENGLDLIHGIDSDFVMDLENNRLVLMSMKADFIVYNITDLSYYEFSLNESQYVGFAIDYFRTVGSIFAIIIIGSIIAIIKKLKSDKRSSSIKQREK